ncbi:MAG TPA: hypothetical protein PKE26_01285 [Kiritimatiellia bacterium]|nr:hypothetical protein [Kiritimatiellia bacterium]HMO97726.1 hypothetical protein [Kiritimatiellia bacterium]HMP95365.1 hypothetical protein [Kiritimatiellia bacterium]
MSNNFVQLRSSVLALGCGMRESSVRSLAWLVTLIVFFPLWVGAQRLFSEGVLAAERAWRWSMPGWMHGLATFLIFAGVLMSLSYLVASRLNRRFPNSPVRDASWNAARH